MRYSTPLLGLIGAAAGLAVATTGYQLVAAPLDPVAHPGEPVAAVGRPLPAAPAEVRTRLAPCTPPAHLRHGVCVTEEWRTTVVYDAPAPAAQPLVAAPQGVTVPTAARRAAGADREHERHADDSRDADDRGDGGEDHADGPEVDD
jgi:hypothetical protein